MKEILKLKRTKLLILLPLGLLFLFLAKLSPFIAEYVFARGLYKILSLPLGLVTGIFPFSMAELIIVLIPALLIAVIICFVVKLVKGRETRKFIIQKAVLNVFCFMAVIFFMFIVLCGTNYYRYDFAEMYNLDVKERSVDELKELCFYLKDMVEQSKADIPEKDLDENGVVTFGENRTYEDFPDVAASAKKAMTKLSEDYPSLKYSTGGAKEVILSRYMSYGGIVGIFIPFTMEANVNTDVADYNRPADTCHELAHMRGYMKEQEANYIAYLACINSEEPVFIYSGYMMAFIVATNSLYDYDSEAYWEIMEGLSDNVLVDIRYENEYWRELRSNEAAEVVDEIMNEVNDTYLKANGQESGVASYGEMVDLLLAEYFSR